MTAAVVAAEIRSIYRDRCLFGARSNALQLLVALRALRPAVASAIEGPLCALLGGFREVENRAGSFRSDVEYYVEQGQPLEAVRQPLETLREFLGGLEMLSRAAMLLAPVDTLLL